MSEQRTGPVAEIYPSFAEVPGRTGYNSEEYLRGLSAYCERRADELLAGDFPHSLQRNLQNNTLIAVAAQMLGRRRLRILDFGGGLGQSFVTLAAGIPDYESRIEYSICDLADTIAYAKANDIYSPRGIRNVRFINEISEAKRCDLAYFGSVLQYVEDFDGLLASIFRLNPRMILVTQTPVVLKAPNFIIAQIKPDGSANAYRTYNLDWLVTAFTKGGYQLIGRASEFDSAGTTKFNHLPPEYHDYRRATLLLERLPMWGRLFGPKRTGKTRNAKTRA